MPREPKQRAGRRAEEARVRKRHVLHHRSGAAPARTTKSTRRSYQAPWRFIRRGRREPEASPRRPRRCAETQAAACVGACGELWRGFCYQAHRRQAPPTEAITTGGFAARPSCTMAKWSEIVRIGRGIAPCLAARRIAQGPGGRAIQRGGAAHCRDASPHNELTIEERTCERRLRYPSPPGNSGAPEGLAGGQGRYQERQSAIGAKRRKLQGAGATRQHASKPESREPRESEQTCGQGEAWRGSALILK